MKENNNIENLEGIISKLKNQGIEAGESEKQRIISAAKEKADKIISDAEAMGKEILDKAKASADQMEKNAKASINQASRDVIEATKITILNKLKETFRKQGEHLLTQEEYLKELLKVVTQMLPGKKTIEVPAPLVKKMQDYLVKETLADGMEIKPLPKNEAKITVTQDIKDGVQFVVTSKDIENAVFSLINKDMVELITKSRED
jgi:V/A-type H+/Na+-transporting ATPase subunit E